MSSTKQPWFQLSVEETLRDNRTKTAGLTSSEASSRLAEHGLNRLTPPKKRGPLLRFLLQFHNILIYVLLAAAGVTALLGHWVDTWVIVGVVVVNAMIGFIQEGKAEKSLDAIRRLLSLRATVMRDGQRQEVEAETLVPGDIVLLASGDKVPADLRLVETRNLRIEEAALTGESEPVEKSPDPINGEVPIGDRTCMAYSSTLVFFGQGRGVVVATGDKTEIGRIGRMLAEVDTLETPLLKQMAGFGRTLTGAILALAGIALAFGTLIHDQPAGEMFLAAVGLAVAAIPEGLPAIMTITLAIGVQRMASRNAIIRRMPAVETLGAITTICSDKTGTLTKNEMTVQRLATADGTFEVGGVGYAPHGGFSADGREISGAGLSDIARVAMLCNDATLRENDGLWQLEGDPTEGAMLTLALKCGLDAHFEAEALPRMDVIPFESAHRFMATLHHDHEGNSFVFVKGAPERVIAMCAWQGQAGSENPIDPAFWNTQIDLLAQSGFRVLALASAPTPSGKRELDFADVEEGLTLLALAGIMDPPRDEAIRAVSVCHAAGIRIKMITGDHVVTAAAIARAMGIGGGDGVDCKALTGADVEVMSDEALRQAVRDVDVFARASPEHKLRLVEALQANGEVTAMTGDGVNDAPALKRADVGVAMGQKGTEAAKEAAEMVLADDNFASIAAAIEEGRTIYDNLKKSIVFIIPTNGGEAAMVLVAILFGMTLPISPVQILWVNMVTAVTLSLALAFERPEPGLMKRPPRDPRAALVNAYMLWRIGFVSVLLAATSFSMFFWQLEREASIEVARTATVNTLVMGELFYLFNCRSLSGSILSRDGLFGNPRVLQAIGLLLVLQFLFTHLPFAHALFHTADIDALTWLCAIAAGILLLLVVELEKSFWRKRENKRNPIIKY